MTIGNLKRHGILLVCGAMLGAMPVAAQTSSQSSSPAQTDAPPPPPPPPMGGPRGGGPEQRLAMLQRELNLTTDQTAQVKALFAAERTKAEALRSNTAAAPEDRHSQMMSIRQETETKLQALLTPDQVTKYQAMQARMRQRMEERGQRGDGPPPPPPAPQP